MKLVVLRCLLQGVQVTLCVRVWIEIAFPPRRLPARFVTLCVRVWIEMAANRSAMLQSVVTLCVRVWIEIL